MRAANATSPSAPRPRRTGRIAAILMMVTTVALAAGATALAANFLRHTDGYLGTSTETFASSGYAIAMKSVDVSDAPRWLFGDAVLVEAHSERPLFVGVARTADLDRYLRRTEHDDISGLTYHPFRVDYDHTRGDAPDRAPVDESFWVASTSGSRSVALDWKPRPGNWRAVLMNADGSRGVTAELRLAARTPLLRWLGAALLGVGVLAAAAAAALHRHARDRRTGPPRARRDAPPASPCP